MKIRIVGAAGGEVTGSAYFVQTDHTRILVDAGMFQGGKSSEAKNRIPERCRSSRTRCRVAQPTPISIIPVACPC